METNDILSLHGLPSERVLLVFLHIGKQMHEVKQHSLGGTARSLIASQRESAMVEGKCLCGSSSSRLPRLTPELSPFGGRKKQTVLRVAILPHV